MINDIYDVSLFFYKAAHGFAREWPDTYGVIRKNYDLGEGPYSQNNGLPYGGMSAKEYIEKKRKEKKKKNVNKK